MTQEDRITATEEQIQGITAEVSVGFRRKRSEVGLKNNSLGLLLGVDRSQARECVCRSAAISMPGGVWLGWGVSEAVEAFVTTSAMEC